MTKLEPAESVAERVLDESVDNDFNIDVEKAAALLEADRAAVREAAIREALVWVRRYAGDGFATNLERALLSPTPSSKGGSGDGR